MARCADPLVISTTSSSLTESVVDVLMLIVLPRLVVREPGTLFSPLEGLVEVTGGLPLGVFAFPVAVDPRFDDANESVPCLSVGPDAFDLDFGAIIEILVAS